MMILGNFRLQALGLVLAGLAAPALAGTPVARAVKNANPAESQSADSTRSRRVELPFPPDVRTPDSQPRASGPQDRAQGSSGPHPYREIRLQRAAFVEPGPLQGTPARLIRRNLSQYPDFS